jgi:molecular chaperone DnaJ
VFGGEKEIEIPREEMCPVCNGSRVEPGHEPVLSSIAADADRSVRATGSLPSTDLRVLRRRRAGHQAPLQELQGQGDRQDEEDVEGPDPSRVDNNTRLKLRGEGMQQPEIPFRGTSSSSFR